MKIITIITLCLFILFPVFSSYSQDLIVRQNGDSIECKIDKLSNNYIYYFTIEKNKEKNNSIHTSDVKTYEFGYFTRHPEESKIRYNSQDIREPKDYKWIQIGINGGMGKRTKDIKNTTPYPLDDYYKKLQKGLLLSADVTYFFNRNFGAGLKYSLLASSNKLENVSYTDSLGNANTGEIKDKMRISCISLFFTAKQEFDKNIIYADIGIGQLMYYDDNYYLNNSFPRKGRAFGFIFDVGYDYLITKDFSIGARVSYQGGILKNLSIDGITSNLHKDHRINLSNLSLSLGLKFYIY